MKKVLTIAAIAMMMVGSTAFACDTCGCTPKKAEDKAECSACTKDKECAKCAKKGRQRQEVR
jgi:hypothetical protein